MRLPLVPKPGSPRRRRLRILALLIGAALAAPAARAVIVRLPADVAQSPSPGPALTHLAVVAGLSGVYLGDGWLLTAGHVLQNARDRKRTDVVIGGRPFALRIETARSIQEGEQRPDLAVVRIDGDPGLPRLPIARATPPVGTEVILAGNGPLQDRERRCWSASGQQVGATSPGGACGYAWRKTPEGDTNGVGWGTNQVASVGQSVSGPAGARTMAFTTEFRADGGTAREAQAAVGDSGGPVLAREGGSPVLAGIMIAAAARSSNATLFGDRTMIADLAHYRDEILGITGPAER